MKVKISCLEVITRHSYVEFEVDVPDTLQEDQVEEYLNDMRLDVEHNLDGSSRSTMSFNDKLDELHDDIQTWGDGDGLDYFGALGFEGGDWINEQGREVRYDIVGKKYGGHLIL